ncbi:MAG TPA: hypothetical protein VHZ04_03445 [Candidatus Paceibacterota bacterium]|jgi:hypothetical protein|nr:hypothetical protein [Candidatus Paceibacterota bacterium]
MKSITKDHPALHVNGNRTIYGYFDKGDIPRFAETYPLIEEDVVARIADAINAPRLLEVSTILEVVHRYLEGSFSLIRGLSLKAVSNPLSVLFWNEEQERVQRVKTRESELMHGACEKLALRTDGVAKVNEILAETFGLRLAFGCSCCAIVVHRADAEALFASEHYRNRETYGRLFDSDVLCVTGDLLEADSVADLPPDILDASADFHKAEVESYLRFARVNEAVVTTNIVAANPPIDTRLVEFLKGNVSLNA